MNGRGKLGFIFILLKAKGYKAKLKCITVIHTPSGRSRDLLKSKENKTRQTFLKDQLIQPDSSKTCKQTRKLTKIKTKEASRQVIKWHGTEFEIPKTKSLVTLEVEGARMLLKWQFFTYSWIFKVHFKILTAFWVHSKRSGPFFVAGWNVLLKFKTVQMQSK